MTLKKKMLQVAVMVRLLALDTPGVKPIGSFAMTHGINKMLLFIHIYRCKTMASLPKFKEFWLQLEF